jgi:myo-inositol-1(or 4)-monophosphatase
VGPTDHSKEELELLLKHHKLVAGVIYDPTGGEMFSATTEYASTLNQAPIKASDVELLERAIIGIDWSRDFDQRQSMLQIISQLAHRVHTIRAIGSAAEALAWVACGRLDVYINLGVGPWDVAAAKVIITSAGGTVTNFAGEPWNLWHPGCLASNGLLHDQLLDQIRRLCAENSWPRN